MSSEPIAIAPSAPQSGRESAPLLITAKECAAMVGIGQSNWYKQWSLGRVPEPVQRIGRLVRWRRQDIVDWVAAGCPVPKVQRNRK